VVGVEYQDEALEQYYAQPINVHDFASRNALIPERIRNEDKCPICLENYEDNSLAAIFVCGHTFCVECANASLSSMQPYSHALKLECPICRMPVQSYRPIRMMFRDGVWIGFKCCDDGELGIERAFDNLCI